VTGLRVSAEGLLLVDERAQRRNRLADHVLHPPGFFGLVAWRLDR
jgi:hypothetical protein